ncbi:MAG: VWA domain-containing protein [Chloroflexi bacterium]|nr:VWA domain-containing protein [Chloroflexota bacterium]MBU1749034.1 VWA domain-containing protein [Chloroflexota bacterium]MBU1880271.1 VWA domain-containing protein [Chloroflexota bacterium]
MKLLSPGTILHDKYGIKDVIGYGTQRTVYLGYMPDTKEYCFIWEAEPRINVTRRPPQLLAYFREGERDYVITGVEGQDLALLQSAAGNIQEKWVIRWGIQICTNLKAWHEHKPPVIHLRYKPMRLADIQFAADGSLLLPTLRGSWSESDADESANHFAAPEHAPQDIGPPSDVYAVGALLYCLLLGFAPPAPQERQQVQDPLVPPRRLDPVISRPLEKVLLKALALAPQDRYRTAAEMRKALAGCAKGDPALRRKKQMQIGGLLFHPIIAYAVVSFVFLCAAMAFVGAGLAVSNMLVNAPTPTVSVPWTRDTKLTLIINQISVGQFPTVITYMSVLDKDGRPFRNVGREHLRVFQDGRPVSTFSAKRVSVTQDPLSLVMAIDVSGSMKGEPMDRAKEAAAKFVRQLSPQDSVCLVAFSGEVHVVHDFTTDKTSIIAAIEGLEANGDTALFDVVGASATLLSTQPNRHAAIILTDGCDTASTTYELDSCMALARSTNVPVYAIGLQGAQFTPEILERIAADSGGRYLYAPTPNELDALYQQTRGQLQDQYRITFDSLHPADHAEHTITVELVAGNIHESSNKQYLSP